jgi:transglutaminase-like putative cysteine protease
MMKTSTSLESFDPNRSQKLWLMFAIALIMIPHAAHLPTWAFLGTLGLLGYVFLITIKNWPPIPKILLWTIGAIGFAACFIYFGNLNGRDPGVTLLSLMTALKLHEMKSQRDAYITIFLGYFLIITQFLFAQEMVLILYLLATTLLLTIVLTGLSDPSDCVPLKKRLQLSSRMLVLSIPMMLLLFVLFPRISGPLWGIQQGDDRAKTGLSDEMSPGQFSELIRSDELAFRAVFEDSIPAVSQRYWRGPVLWRFDGLKWTRGYNPPFLLPGSDIQFKGDPINYRLMIEPTQKNWVMALDVTTSTPPDVSISGDLQVYSKDPIRELKEISLQAHPEYRIGTRPSSLEKRLGLRLPDGFSPRAMELAQQWQTQLGEPELIVNAALQYYRNQPFVYTLSPGQLSRDPVDQFLFETRRGFCEHYAGSFVFLMRAAGIPARVVTGYLGGEYNNQVGYMTIRQSDAHAWAEVWIEDRGWVRIDPTAAVSPERIEEGISSSLSANDELPLLLRNRYGDSLINRFRLMLDSADYYWNYWVVSFGPERQQELLSKMGLEDMDWRGLIILLVSSIGLISLAYILLFILKNRQSPRDPLSQAYHSFRRKLQKAGIDAPDNEGPMDLLTRLQLEQPELVTASEAIITQYIRARYQSLPDEKVTNHFSRLVKAFDAKKIK